MTLLLDTHVALWWASAPTSLSQQASAAIADPSNTVWVSAASAWELAIKVRAGKLSLDVLGLMEHLAAHGARVLGIGVDDGAAAGLLDWSHRDPFDRMLVAQARRADLALVTRDAVMLAFEGVRSLAA